MQPPAIAACGDSDEVLLKLLGNAHTYCNRETEKLQGIEVIKKSTLALVPWIWTLHRP